MPKVALEKETAQLGCIVCLVAMDIYSPAEIHHLRAGVGMGQRSSRCIPLCPHHHRLGKYGVAFHAGPREFEKRYGTEDDLYETTQDHLRRRGLG